MKHIGYIASLSCLVVGLIFSLSINSASAKSASDFQKAMKAAMQFSNMFPEGQSTVSSKEYKRAKKYLSKAVKFASRISYDELTKMVDDEFANEFRLFTLSLRLRLEGWENSNRDASIQGIRGMERFRRYYNANRNRIYSSMATHDEKSGWITWNPKKGEFIPRIGCEKGAVIAWLAGC